MAKRIKIKQNDWRAETENLVSLETEDKQTIKAPLWLLIKLKLFATLFVIPENTINPKKNVIELPFKSNVIIIYLDLLNNQDWEINLDVLVDLLKLAEYFCDPGMIEDIIQNLDSKVIYDLKLYGSYPLYLKVEQFINMLFNLKLPDIIKIVEAGYLRDMHEPNKSNIIAMTQSKYKCAYICAYLLAKYTDWNFTLYANFINLQCFIQANDHFEYHQSIENFIKSVCSRKSEYSSDYLRERISWNRVIYEFVYYTHYKD